ncbi:MAG: hypothetical protein LBU67_09230 [Oscillospiraceae bacterium]|jgi:hypothetical protein|nr:hypothetical protein [Oscillospiraceae bacterium]
MLGNHQQFHSGIHGQKRFILLFIFSREQEMTHGYGCIRKYLCSVVERDSETRRSGERAAQHRLPRQYPADFYEVNCPQIIIAFTNSGTISTEEGLTIKTYSMNKNALRYTFENLRGGVIEKNSETKAPALIFNIAPMTDVQKKAPNTYEMINDGVIRSLGASVVRLEAGASSPIYPAWKGDGTLENRDSDTPVF